MIKRRRQILSLAAIPDIDAHDIETGLKSFIGGGHHVSRRRRPFHAVPHHQRGVLGSIRLPTTKGQHATPGLNFKQPGFVLRTILGAEPSWPEIRGKGLRVGLSKDAVGNERRGREFS